MGRQTLASRWHHSLLGSLFVALTGGMVLGCSDTSERGAPAVEGAVEDEAFETADRRWEYVPVAGARCGNGSAYGVAVNRSVASRQLVLLLASG